MDKGVLVKALTGGLLIFYKKTIHKNVLILRVLGNVMKMKKLL